MVLQYYIIILWDHRRIFGPSLTVDQNVVMLRMTVVWSPRTPLCETQIS